MTEVKKEAAEVKKISTAKMIQWAITAIIVMSVLLVPCTASFTFQIKMFIVVTALGILLVAFELLNLMAVSMMMPIGYLVFGLGPAEVVYSAWTMTLPTVMIGGYLLANILDRVGLLKRIAYWSVIRVGGSYYGMLFGIFIAGTILNIATGGNAWVIMAAFTYGLCKSFNLGKSRDSTLIMLVGAFAATSTCVFAYTPYFMSILLNGTHSVDPTIKLTWMQFFIHMCPYALFMVVFVWLMPKLFKPTQKLPGKEFYLEEYKKLGKMDRDEAKSAIVSAGLILFMLTGGIHGIELDWAFIVIPWLLFLPGVGVGREEDVRKIDFSMIFFLVACLTIGKMSAHLGLGKLLADMLVPMLEPLSPSIVIFAIYIIGVLLNLMMTPLAILAGFSEPIAQVTGALGMNPLGAQYALSVAFDQVFMPYEYMNYLLFYAFGMIKMNDFVKIMSLKTVLVSVFVIAVMIPWWFMVGVI